MKAALLLVVMVALAAPARALSEPVRSGAGVSNAQWRQLGAGELRWLGMRVYRASLWVAGERFDRSDPFALRILYDISVARDRLVETSIEEIERLGWQGEERLSRWSKMLSGVFPDVKGGEEIVGVHLGGGRARFFHQGRPVGELSDPELVRAFFAIWLDERSRSAQLREQLLGLR
jgi:hypothetical protein